MISCTLRNIIDTKYSYLVFPPLVYWMMSNFNASRILIVFTMLCLWSFAFTCSQSGNLFIRVFESNLIFVILSFGILTIMRYLNAAPLIQVILTMVGISLLNKSG